MGQRYIIKQTKHGLFQIPIDKYTMQGEVDGITLDEVKKLANSLGLMDIDIGQLFEGTKIEAKEHSDIVGSNVEKAVRIAAAHLKEIPDYYTRLKQIEMTKVYEEEKHPRDSSGRWATGGGSDRRVGVQGKFRVGDRVITNLKARGRIARGMKGKIIDIKHYPEENFLTHTIDFGRGNVVEWGGTTGLDRHKLK